MATREIKSLYALDGDKMKFRYNWKTRKGGNGFGLSEENVSYTLNTIDQHMVGIIYGKGKERGVEERKGVCKGCQTYRPRRRKREVGEL